MAWLQWSWHGFSGHATQKVIKIWRQQNCFIYKVQESDPLGRVFSLVFMEFLDAVGPIPGIALSLWYLDNGNFVGDYRYPCRKVIDAYTDITY